MEEQIILFHGSNAIVEQPEIRVYGHFKDFGYGFYCTRIEQQAKKWALTKGSKHVVSLYKFTEREELMTKSFVRLHPYNASLIKAITKLKDSSELDEIMSNVES